MLTVLLSSSSSIMLPSILLELSSVIPEEGETYRIVVLSFLPIPPTDIQLLSSAAGGG